MNNVYWQNMDGLRDHTEQDHLMAFDHVKGGYHLPSGGCKADIMSNMRFFSDPHKVEKKMMINTSIKRSSSLRMLGQEYYYVNNSN